MPLKLSLCRPRVMANDVIAKQRIGESERIKVNHLIQSLDIVFIAICISQFLHDLDMENCVFLMNSEVTHDQLIAILFQNTFHFDSPYWSDKNVTNLLKGKMGLTARRQSYRPTGKHPSPRFVLA